MLLIMNAKEREEDDWKGLFEKADPRFKYLGARQPQGSQMWIIEAIWDVADGHAAFPVPRSKL